MIKLNSKILQNKLVDVSKNIDLAGSNIEINEQIENLLTSFFDVEFASLWFYDEHNMTLLRERRNAAVRTLSLEEKRGIIYKCFMTQEAKIYNYLKSDKDYIAAIDNPDDIKMKSKIIVPLIDDENFIGIVTLYTSVKKAKKFTKEDLKMLQALSSYLIEVLYKMHPCADKDCDCHKIELKNRESSIIKNMQKIERRRKDRRKDNQNFSEKTDASINNFIHDIRTPANTLQGFLELLEEQITDKRLKEYIINAKESAAFINELTTAMLDRVSLQNEEEISEVKEVNSTRFFAAIAEMFISNMYTKKIAFNIYIDPLLPKKIEVDVLKLKRIIINLIGNAYKFTPYGKFIEFEVKYNKKSKDITISVKDKGIGIAKEKQAQIFEAFKQADDTTSLMYGGTGLGLSICAEYVENLGGKLELTSEIDKGSTFYFTLPLDIKDVTPSFKPIKNKNVKIAVLMQAKNSLSLSNIVRYLVQMNVNKNSIEAVASMEDITKDTTHLIVYQNQLDKITQDEISRFEKVFIVEEEPFLVHDDELAKNCEIAFQYGYYAVELYKFINTQQIPRVLIVDDDKISVLLLERILESEYCDVDVAQNGKLALEMIIDSHKKRMPYNVIYIDNKMPVMNGFEVMQHVREYESDNGLSAVYAISTSGDIFDLDKEGQNFDAYVGKPFRADEIRKFLYR